VNGGATDADRKPSFRVVIPARLGSTRLPEKVLRPIAGRPLVQFVYDAARASGAVEVVIATDSERVEAVCRAFGADVAMTAVSHASGTDRINEVAQARRWPADTIVVNVQGDEPLMPPAMIREAAALLQDDADADIATLCHPLHAREDWLNPNFVKVVLDTKGRALYFSRAPIPWKREGTSRESALPDGLAYRHIGLYAYRVGALARFAALPSSPLEACESLEQLRALENGLRIRVGVSLVPPPRGVDTEEDLAAVAAVLASGSAVST
jgi:3-deoxy-manno-octulosonate cytidylyltransferase (CMP-KDO synthetase)